MRRFAACMRAVDEIGHAFQRDEWEALGGTDGRERCQFHVLRKRARAREERHLAVGRVEA